MVEQLGAAASSRGSLSAKSQEAWAERLSLTLEQAQAAPDAGDAAAAERAGRAVSALVKAIKDVETLQDFARAQRPEKNAEELREDLERRIARFIGADRALDLLGEPDGG